MLAQNTFLVPYHKCISYWIFWPTIILFCILNFICMYVCMYALSLFTTWTKPIEETIAIALTIWHRIFHMLIDDSHNCSINECLPFCLLMSLINAINLNFQARQKLQWMVFRILCPILLMPVNTSLTRFICQKMTINYI